MDVLTGMRAINKNKLPDPQRPPCYRHSLVLSLSSSRSEILEDPTPPASPVMEYSFGGRPLACRPGQAMRAAVRRFPSMSQPSSRPRPPPPPRSSTFACLQKQSSPDADSMSECRRIAGGLRHFPAQAMAIVGVSPTGEPWESPRASLSPSPPPCQTEEVGEVEDEDVEAPSGNEEEECAVPLLGRLPTG